MAQISFQIGESPLGSEMSTSSDPVSSLVNVSLSPLSLSVTDVLSSPSIPAAPDVDTLTAFWTRLMPMTVQVEEDDDAAHVPVETEEDETGEMELTLCGLKRGSSSAVMAVDSDRHGCLVYMVLNSDTDGSASLLLQIGLTLPYHDCPLGLHVLSALSLHDAYASRVDSMAVNPSGTRLVLSASRCRSLDVFSTRTSHNAVTVCTDRLALHSSAIRSSGTAAVLGFVGVGFVSPSLAVGGAVAGVFRGKQWDFPVGCDLLVAGLQASSAEIALSNKLVFVGIPALPGDASSLKTCDLPRGCLHHLAVKPCCAHFTTSSNNSSSALLSAPLLLLGLDKAHRLFRYSYAPTSDFPGPMYPVGYQLVHQCVAYREAEDELDRVMSAGREAEEGAIMDTTQHIPVHVEQSGQLVLDVFPNSGRYVSSYLRRLPLAIPDLYSVTASRPMPINRGNRGGRGRKRKIDDESNVASKNTSSPSAPVLSVLMDEEPGSGSESEDSDQSHDEEEEEGDDLKTNPMDRNTLGDALDCSAWDWSGGMRYPLTEGRLQEEVLGLPTRIVTGDFFSKLQRDRDFGRHTLSLCSDANSVRESMLRLQVEAVERAVAYEEKKERDRLRREEKNEEKRNRLIDEQRQAWELKQRNEAAAALQRIHEQQKQQQQVLGLQSVASFGGESLVSLSVESLETGLGLSGGDIEGQGGEAAAAVAEEDTVL